ncbi:MAG: extracellular solute-binding protein [Chloroflexi bacterium]|nr:extracellular solute-binding protein [Chloroflexota bacterium]
MFKKSSILSLIVLLGMVGVLIAGCAQQDVGPAAPVSEGSSVPADEAAETVDQTSATLTVWTGYPELEPFYRDVATQFQVMYPNVKFEFLSTTLREFEAKLQTALPTCSGPDVFDVESNITPILVAGQLIEPNPPEIDAIVKSGAYNDFVVNYFTYDGKTYGIPMIDGSLASLFYNKDMFIEAGLDPETPPKTFDEMMEYAKKLTQYDENGEITVSGMSMRLSGQGSGIAEKFWFFLHNMGGDVIVPSDDGKGWHNGYDNAAGQKALAYYIDSVYKYHVTDHKVPSDAVAFEAGQAAMLLRESWVISDIAANAPDLNYGVAPMPSDVRFDTMTLPAGVYVASCSENKTLAWEYAKLLTNDANTINQVKLTGWLSDRSVDMTELLKEIPEYEAFVNPPAELGYYSYPLLTSFDEILTKMADRLVAAYLDGSLVDNPDGIAETIKAMAEETDSILKANGQYAP